MLGLFRSRCADDRDVRRIKSERDAPRSVMPEVFGGFAPDGRMIYTDKRRLLRPVKVEGGWVEGFRGLE